MTRQRSVVLLGGGLDSLAALEYSLSVQGDSTRPSRLFHFTYGNVTVGPVEAAWALSSYYHVSLELVDLGQVLPSDYAGGLLHSEDGVSQYLPDRNLVFLALVSAWVKSKWRSDVVVCYTGFSVGAPSIYDITPGFVSAMNALYALDRQAQFKVSAPFVAYNKAQVLQYLLTTRAPVELTYTCYLGERIQCGECVTCVRRIDAFKELGVVDPVPYRVAVDWNGCKVHSTLKAKGSSTV